MTIAYNWLKEYIEIPETPEELGKILTSTGLEVESVEVFETVKGGLAGLVIGEVLTCVKHPNADKLSLTTVDVGQDKPLQIVCGAKNVAQGQKIVVALPGATIYPVKGEAFTIKAAKIRGELSEGMICAEDEIGLGENHSGIIVLDKSAATGASASQFFNIQSDHILEIGLTPNRADATSHIGVVRDIRASTNRLIKWPAVESFRVDNQNLSIPVVVKDPEACPRYSALTISGVKVADSPQWLQNRLRAIGLTPINNIVDITNFVCHEMGQPLHAFDAAAIAGNKVIVKTLAGGTKFTTLDGKVRTLLSTDLMICRTSSKQPGDEEGMCIAGVFGGADSGIKESTRNIFLESAHFSPAFVRRSSLHHQLKTDASFRFERGTDPNITVYALKRAALLIKEIAGGNISSDVVDVYATKIENRSIEIKDRNVNRLIGKRISREEIFSILKGLDIEVIENKEDRYTVSVPPYRVDVLQEADIIEEILRIYGFNKIELSNTAKTDFLAEFPVKNIDKFKRSTGELLVANGFFEIWTNSLTNQSYQEKYQLTFEGENVEILNKLSEEQGVLRQTMMFTGLEVCSYNINRKQKDLRLYEFGKVYCKKDGKYLEQEKLALYITGNLEAENWQHKTQAAGYYDLAQHIHNIFQKTGIKEIKQEAESDQLFEYAVKLTVQDKEIGKAGKVKSALLKDFGIKQEIFFAELDTSLLFKFANPKLVIQEVAKFPEVKRDLSLVLDAPVTFDEIRNLIMDTEKRLIKNIGVFDVYEGENIPKGKKAYALSFTLQDETKTLTDDEIERTMQRLIAAFEQKLGAVIRK
ncbi:MAG: phenylalanine--tRNA ligase subunit beta [Cyclobacteriaceae bacterium]